MCYCQRACSPYKGTRFSMTCLSKSWPRQRSCRLWTVRQRPALSRHGTGYSSEDCLPQKAVRLAAAVLGALAAGALLAVVLLPAHARVKTERLGQSQFQTEQQGELQAWYQGLELRQRSAWKEVESRPLSVKEQVSEVQRLTKDAKQATTEGDYPRALEDYTRITRRFPDLAITNYAKLGRALLLYQVGSKRPAILELEDLEVELRGYAEVHAALASIIYSERPADIAYAEEQFDIASEFDQRYSDVRWVQKEKSWPPAMLTALDKFLNLK